MDTDPSPLQEALANLGAAMAHAHKVAAEALWQEPQDVLVEALKELHRVNAVGASLQLRITREVDVRAIPATLGAVSLRAFLGARADDEPGAGRGTRPAVRGPRVAVRRHRRRPRHRVDLLRTGQGDRRGRHRPTQDRRRRGPGQGPGLPPGQGRRVELHRPTRARQDHRRRPGPRRHPRPRGQRHAARRGADIRNNHNGTQTLTWTDIDENIAHAKAAIEALSAPAPAEDGTHDPRTASVRRADALVDLCLRILDTGTLPTSRGIRPHLHVTFTEETLKGEPGAPPARTATGEHLSPHTIQRLICDASLTGILLDGNGVPLKLGRTTAPCQPGQWIALLARDTGCQFPGCTRPAVWCPGA